MSKTLVFGDSIAAGLALYLIQRDHDSNNITNAGIVGESCSGALKRAKNYNGYDTIYIATTTNDWGVPTIGTTYESILTTLEQNNSGATIYCLASPGVVSSCTSYKNIDNSVIRTHNQEIATLSNSHQSLYVDTYNILKDQETSDLKYRAPDGLHLNNSGYALLTSNLKELDDYNSTSINNVHFNYAPLSSTNITVSSKYGPREGGTHEGIDLIVPGAGDGEIPVIAVAPGTVTRAEWSDSYGWVVYIDHGNGVATRYAHMYAKPLVTKGSGISGGTQLGYMGNTGDSSGTHLHFEVLINGAKVDPAPYINGNAYINPTGVTNTYVPSGESGASGIPYSGGVTVGQRVAGVTPQPLHAYVNIYVGDNLLLLSTEPPKPNILQSFEYNRLQDAGESVTITLFDDNWEEIEKVLSENFDRLYMEYGYYGTPLKSKLIRLRLLTFSLSFQFTGTLLNITAVTEGSFDNLKQKSIALNTYNPTEAVKKICENLGYKILEENFDPSKDIIADDPFNLVEDFPLTYIRETIIPQAAEQGEEIFRFRVDDEGYAYFKRWSYQPKNVVTDTMRTYIYQKGYDSTVIDFTCDIKGVFGGAGDFETATTLRASVFDKSTKESEYDEVTKSTVVTAATGEVSYTKSDQSNPIVDTAGYSPAQTKNRIYYAMKSVRHDAYEAHLTIVGDPTLTIFNEYIRIINVTDKGYLHWTSGVYLVLEISDSISNNGTMITNLRLMRNASIDDIKGLEIINPHALLK